MAALVATTDDFLAGVGPARAQSFRVPLTKEVRIHHSPKVA